MIDETWFDVKSKLPDVGERVRVLVVKEMTYMGKIGNNAAEWKYDALGEHGVYSWCRRLKECPLRAKNITVNVKRNAAE